MPGYKGHISVSLLCCGLLFLFPLWSSLPWLGKMICVGIAVFFGLWPDVDTKSKGQFFFLLGFIIADLILIYRQDFKRAAYLGLLIALPLMARHRGWTHHWLAMILIPGGAYLAAIHYSGGEAIDLLPYFLAGLLGYASHLIADRYF